MSGRTKRKQTTNDADVSGLSGGVMTVAKSNFGRMCALPEPTAEEFEYLSFLEEQEDAAAMSSEEPGLSLPDAFETSSEREAREAQLREHQQDDRYYGSETECSQSQVAGLPFPLLTQGMTPREVAQMRSSATGLQQDEWTQELRAQKDSAFKQKPRSFQRRRFEDMCSRIGSGLPDICPRSYIGGDGTVRGNETYQQQDARYFRRYIGPTLRNMTGGPVANAVGGIGAMKGRSVETIRGQTDSAALIDNVIMSHGGMGARSQVRVPKATAKRSAHQEPYRPKGYDHRGRVRTTKRRR